MCLIHSLFQYLNLPMLFPYLDVSLSVPSTDSSVLDALERVSVLPERFLKFNPNYVFKPPFVHAICN